jgi:hypothetical protein
MRARRYFHIDTGQGCVFVGCKFNQKTRQKSNARARHKKAINKTLSRPGLQDLRAVKASQNLPQGWQHMFDSSSSKKRKCDSKSCDIQQI